MSFSRRRVSLLLLSGIVLAGGAVWYFLRPPPAVEGQALLYGNVDIRTVDLAFQDSGRIADIAVQEGARVSQGQLLARLDAARFEAALEQARGTLGAARERLARLQAGSRPQEIAAARANVAAALAAARNAAITYDRQAKLAADGMQSQQAADDARRARDAARANLDAARQALSLAVQGPRVEDIAAAQAQVQAARGALALAERQLADTRLYAPADGVIQTRILEPGDMASPQVPVLTLALEHPLWVRAYAPEPLLGRLASGMRAQIDSDSYPGRHFVGWIGFISPTAEFTPQSVQTTDLRTQLVYRLRVYVCRPHTGLRLGMPVTVRVPLIDNPPRARPDDVCGR